MLLLPVLLHTSLNSNYENHSVNKQLLYCLDFRDLLKREVVGCHASIVDRVEADCHRVADPRLHIQYGSETVQFSLSQACLGFMAPAEEHLA